MPKVKTVADPFWYLTHFGTSQRRGLLNDADFTQTEYAGAHEVIVDCIRRIRRGEFTPSRAVEFDDYAMILQTGAVATLFEQLAAAEEQ